MARFDAYAGVGRSGRYVVDLQSSHLDQLPSRIVAPLVLSDTAPTLSELTPLVRFQGADYILQTFLLASIPVAGLQRPVGFLYADQDAIKRSLDILLTGF